MGLISQLSHREAAEVNADYLAQLFSDLGQEGAEGVLCRALEDLSARLTGLEDLFVSGRHEELGKRARRMAAVAEQIGMLKLAAVARDVDTASGQKDPAALGATLARLMRVGDTSLSSVWETDGLGF